VASHGFRGIICGDGLAVVESHAFADLERPDLRVAGRTEFRRQPGNQLAGWVNLEQFLAELRQQGVRSFAGRVGTISAAECSTDFESAGYASVKNATPMAAV